MSDCENAFVFKITVLGDGIVGKSALIKKYTQGSSQKDYIKILGAQFSRFDTDINGDHIKLFFWDIAGQAEFRFMRPTFYKGSKAALIVFSHRYPLTFEHVIDWHEDITTFCGNLPIFVLGVDYNSESEDNVDNEEIADLISTRNFLGYQNISARTESEIRDVFQILVRHLHDKFKDYSPPASIRTISRTTLPVSTRSYQLRTRLKIYEKPKIYEKCFVCGDRLHTPAMPKKIRGRKIYLLKPCCNCFDKLKYDDDFKQKSVERIIKLLKNKFIIHDYKDYWN